MPATHEKLISTLMELAVFKNSLEYEVPLEGVKLRALILTRNDLIKALDFIKNEYDCIEYSINDQSVMTVKIKENIKMPEIDDTQKNDLYNKSLKRALLFKLYEEYIFNNSIHERFPLVNIADELEVTRDTIFRIVTLLDKTYYLEYRGIDGGNCTSSITPSTIEFIEDGRIYSELMPLKLTMSKNSEGDKSEEVEIDSKKVFVVHGRNKDINNSIFQFLRAIGLDPIEWNQARALTKKPNPYIGEILDSAFNSARAILVIFTGDDDVILRNEFQGENEPAYETALSQQPRPNVIFEAGMAAGRNIDRTVFVEVGNVKPFSDLAGRHIIRLNNSPSARKELVDRLEDAGCDIDIKNKSHWFSVGNFE